MRQVRAYVRGPRFRRPPRGAMYQTAKATTMTAAAIATMATVEAATITRGILSPRFARRNLSRERYRSRSRERQRESGEDGEVGVKLYLRQPAHPEWSKPVVGFQVCERPLYRAAPTVEAAEPLRVASDVREQPSAESNRHHGLPALCTTERDHRLAGAFFAFGVDAGVVVALVHRARGSVEAPGSAISPNPPSSPRRARARSRPGRTGAGRRTPRPRRPASPAGRARGRSRPRSRPSLTRRASSARPR
jgi:hypothetical protein